jgi:hypothetical protein
MCEVGSLTSSAETMAREPLAAWTRSRRVCFRAARESKTSPASLVQLPAPQSFGDGLELGQPHFELCLADDRQTALGNP